MANRNWASGGKIYSMHKEPVLLDCNFIVDNSSVNGLGISSLKGPAIHAVYMNSSATPSILNPASGTIVVQLSDNYNRLFSEFHAIRSPLSGSPVTSVTEGTVYVITSLGTATVAQFQARGVAIGITPAVGVSFVASSTGSIGGSATVDVEASAGSGIATIEIVGDSNLSIAPNPNVNQGYGSQIILQCRDYAGAIAAPANGSVISLAFYLSNSSIIVQGE